MAGTQTDIRSSDRKQTKSMLTDPRLYSGATCLHQRAVTESEGDTEEGSTEVENRFGSLIFH